MIASQRFVKRRVTALDIDGQPIPGLKTVSFRGQTNRRKLEFGAAETSAVIRCYEISDRYGKRISPALPVVRVGPSDEVNCSEGFLVSIQDSPYRWHHGRTVRLLRALGLVR